MVTSGRRALRGAAGRVLSLAVLAGSLGACAAREPADTPTPALEPAASAADSTPWSPESLERDIGRVAAETSGEIGAAAIHLETGRRVAWNGTRRFPMASVYKLPLALEALRQVDAGLLSLDDSLTIRPSEFVGGANPLAESAGGHPITVTIGRLIAYMLTESDNTASDAVLRAIGGPEAVRRRLRELGTLAIDVSRYEAEIFAEARAQGSTPAAPERADLRDTATPVAMAELLALVAEGAGLSAMSRGLLLAYLSATTVGPGRIKGLLPPGTLVAHKTGTFDRVTNDVGLVTLPDGSHFAIAVLVEGRVGGSIAERERAIARVSRAVYDAFLAPPRNPSAPGP